ncbi:hypothetical protein B0T22DRAFT_490933, partial [Podospora appendiculata]
MFCQLGNAALNQSCCVLACKKTSTHKYMYFTVPVLSLSFIFVLLCYSGLCCTIFHSLYSSYNSFRYLKMHFLSIIQILCAWSMAGAAMTGSSWSRGSQSLALRWAGAAVAVFAPVMAVPVVDLGHQGYRRANVFEMLRHPNTTLESIYDQARAKNFTVAPYKPSDEAYVSGYVMANLTGIAVANRTEPGDAKKAERNVLSGRLSTRDFVKRQVESRNLKSKKR